MKYRTGRILLSKREAQKVNLETYQKEHVPFLVVNQYDNVLKPIYIPLPEPPPDEEIDNFGLPSWEQFFRYEEYPKGLVALERKVKSVDAIWDNLNKSKVTYRNEIEFLKRQNDRRENGYWTFINGVRTYIPNWHWLFCNWYEIDIGRPEYRSRDLKFFTFAWFCYNDTSTFKHLDANGNAIQKNGQYEMQDLARRICYGFNFPKGRREGATYKAGCANYEITTAGPSRQGGIQSMDGPTGKRAFQEKIVDPWRKMKFFMRPTSASSSDPKTELLFDKPSISARQAMMSVDTETIGLMSKITYANSADRGFYDGEKLHFLNNDECGKTVEEDVQIRWGVQQKCLATGAGLNIHGFAINTSTVGEMEKGGGEAFYKLCEQSHYHKRKQNGQTDSGLYNLFIPSDDGLEGFVDEFGNSIIADPGIEQLQFIKNPVMINGQAIGARRFLEINREAHLNSKADNHMQLYEEEVRQFPLQYEDCFMTGSAYTGFNLKILSERIKILRTVEKTRIGKLEWVSGHDSRVTFIDDSTGPFYMSKVYESNGQSRSSVIKHNGVFYPAFPSAGTICADPYKFLQTDSGRMSKFGMAGFERHDPSIDYSTKELSQWLTHGFIFDYLFRPEKKEDALEDAIKACVYFGFMMFPEINVPAVWDYFIDRKYNGFLKYEMNKDGKYKKTPGFNSLEVSKQELFDELRTYVQIHGFRCNHQRILEQIKNIKGIEDMKNQDLFTAAGGCLLGEKSKYDKLLSMHLPEQSERTVEWNEIYNRRRY